MGDTGDKTIGRGKDPRTEIADLCRRAKAARDMGDRARADGDIESAQRFYESAEKLEAEIQRQQLASRAAENEAGTAGELASRDPRADKNDIDSIIEKLGEG